MRTYRSAVILSVTLLFGLGFSACSEDGEEEEAATSGDSGGTSTSSNSLNGHEYVDLGLSVVWVTCNIGASQPYDFGDYFSWASTSTQEEFWEEDCASFGVSYSDISGTARYDAARSKWGGTWRMPTKTEIQELINGCTWQRTSLNGTAGYLVTGSNGNSIFMPLAGGYEGCIENEGSVGYYWASTPWSSSADPSNEVPTSSSWGVPSRSGDSFGGGG